MRLVEKQTTEGWVTVKMSSIKGGDIFRLFEDHTKTEQVGGDWVAVNSAEYLDGVWGVVAEEKENA